jgi:hypothetical protein
MKIHRLERTMQKIDPVEDYELFLEACMLAGSHGLNLILHRLSVTPDSWDLAHTDTPAHELLFPAEILELVSGLKYIESIRPDYLRGLKPWTLEVASRCREHCVAITRYALKISSELGAGSV